MWDLSCPDWEDRIRAGRAPIPDLPLNQAEADLGLAMFDELRLPDVPGLPRMKEACGPWFRDIVRIAFGSWFPEQQLRYIRDIMMLLPKGQSKTTYVAGLLIALLLMNRRPRAEGLFIGPTQAIAENAYDKAVGMIEASQDLKRRFRTRDHIKTIEDLANHTELKIKTFDVNILTGTILIFAVLEELHLLGRNAHAPKVLRQIRGGLEKTPEGLLLMPTTMPDDIPAGAFKDELINGRKIRAGDFRGKVHRALLPAFWEFPPSIACDKDKWQDSASWPMVMPNLGRSVHLSSLEADWETERSKGEHAIRIWASQHLNIEMGVGMTVDGWSGAAYWAQGEDETITLEGIIDSCDVIIVSLDGGGLDDLYGGNVLGRHKVTRDWLSWSHAWCHEGVLERRQSIASRLLDFKAAGELTIYQTAGDDIEGIIELITTIKDHGLLGGVAVDPAGIGEMVEALAEIDVTVENKLLVGAPQGFGMMNAIKTAERKLQNGTLRHAKSALMDWCVGNVKIEPLATAIRATKQNAGDAKIDPWAALMNGVWMMARNPAAAASRSGWNTDDIDGLMDKIDAAADAMMMGDADNGTQMVQGVGRPV
ncbi:terminase TerL endonuclease subunit [Bradyrhizobium sp. PMVTL-01]|uniref:terminase TerL endonuclease subunit n=1 Tax=Bradyrhizobium sp. PMVTL-01 TaxID=3434999 RepID=UPI003F6F181A